MRVIFILIIVSFFLPSFSGDNIPTTSGNTYVGFLSNGDIYRLSIDKDSNAIFRYSDTSFRYSSIKLGHVIKKGNGLYSFKCKKALSFTICKSFTYGKNNLDIRIDTTALIYLVKNPLKIKYIHNGTQREIVLNKCVIDVKMDSQSNEKINDLLDLEFNLKEFGLNEKIKLKLNYIHTGVLVNSKLDSFDFKISNDNLTIYKAYIDLPPPHNIDSMIIKLKR